MFGEKKFSINKRGGAALKFFAGFLFIFIFVFALNFFGQGIRNTFFSFSLPAQKSFFSAGNSVSMFLGSFLNAGYFAKENQQLKIENENLLAQISSLQSVIEGNRAQTDVSFACQNDSFSLKMAAVTGLSRQDVLTINKGSADKIQEGMPVINQQKALVGIVSKTYKNFSEVSLISAKNSVINVKTLQQDATKSEVDGVVKGKGGNQIFLDLVSIDEIIAQGDVLVTSALEGAFPKDLLVGRIAKVEKNDQSPHQQAHVDAFFNISTDNLFVITNYKQK